MREEDCKIVIPSYDGLTVEERYREKQRKSLPGDIACWIIMVVLVIPTLIWLDQTFGHPHDLRRISPDLAIYAIPNNAQIRWLVNNPDRLHQQVFDEEFGPGQAQINLKWANDEGLDDNVK